MGGHNMYNVTNTLKSQCTAIRAFRVFRCVLELSIIIEDCSQDSTTVGTSFLYEKFHFNDIYVIHEIHEN